MPSSRITERRAGSSSASGNAAGVGGLRRVSSATTASSASSLCSARSLPVILLLLAAHVWVLRRLLLSWSAPCVGPPAAAAAGGGAGGSMPGAGSGSHAAADGVRVVGGGRGGVGGRENAEGAVGPPRFMLYRIIGNNMPPLQCPSQLLWNTQYALEHEGELAGARKRWVLNQIVNATERAMLIDTLLSYGYTLHDVLIRRVNFSRVAEVPREKWLDVVTAQNEARNAAIDDGVAMGARWILPFDGNHFLTQEAWAAITRSADEAEKRGLMYFKVPVHRLHKPQDPSWVNRAATFERVRKHAPLRIESQLAFRNDAPGRFQPGMVYGMQNKLEALARLCDPEGDAAVDDNGEAGKRTARRQRCWCDEMGKEGQPYPSDPKLAQQCGYSLRLWFYPCNGTDPVKVFNGGLYRKRMRTESRRTMAAWIKREVIAVLKRQQQQELRQKKEKQKERQS